MGVPDPGDLAHLATIAQKAGDESPIDSPTDRARSPVTPKNSVAHSTGGKGGPPGDLLGEMDDPYSPSPSPPPPPRGRRKAQSTSEGPKTLLETENTKGTPLGLGHTERQKLHNKYVKILQHLSNRE